jgi:hypothetical protein
VWHICDIQGLPHQGMRACVTALVTASEQGFG